MIRRAVRVSLGIAILVFAWWALSQLAAGAAFAPFAVLAAAVLLVLVFLALGKRNHA